jgi:hypothetical protein
VVRSGVVSALVVADASLISEVDRKLSQARYVIVRYAYMLNSHSS